MEARFAAWRRRWRRVVTLLLLASVGPVLLLWWCAVVYFERSFEEQAASRLAGTLEVQAQRLRAHLEERAGQLRRLAERHEVRLALEAWDGRPSGQTAEALRLLLEEAGRAETRLQGLFVGRGLEAPLLAAARGDDLGWVTRYLPTGRRSSRALRLLVDPTDPGSGVLALAVPAPVPEGAWLGALLEADDLESAVGASGAHGGTLLVRPDGVPLSEAARGQGPIIEEVLSDPGRRGGWVRARDQAGSEVFRQVVWMPAGIDVALVAEVPASRVYAPMSRFHELLALVALLGAGLAALGAALALRTLGRPVERLARTLEDVAAGALPAPPAGAGPEDELALGLIDGVRPAREEAERWKRRASQLESIAGRLSDVAIVGCARDGRVRSLNAGAARLTGRGQGSASGSPLRDLFAPADWERLAPRLFGAGPEAEEIRERVSVLRSGAQPIEAELRVVPVQEPGEEGFLLVLREVGSRTDKERELLASEARLRSLVEGISDGVAVLRGERIEYVNPALARLLGGPAADLRGRTLADFVSARDLLPLLEAVRGTLSGSPPAAPLQATLCGTEPGTARRALISLASGPQPGALLATVRDVTDLERAQEALRLERRRLELTLESTSDGILAVQYHSRGGAVMLANRRLGAIFSLDEATLAELSAGALWERLGDALGRPAGWGERAPLFETPSETAFTDRIEIAGGARPRTLEIFSGPIRDENGRVIGRVATFRDVTDQRRAERALRDQGDELASSRAELERAYRDLELFNQDLERRTQELTRLNRELKSLDEMKSTLLANVSHELQTPLVSVKGYTEMILKEKLGPLTEQQRRGLEVSLKNVNRLIGLIDNLLSFSRMEGEMVDLRPETFPLRPVVDEAVETVRARAQERQIEIVVSERLNDAAVRADRDKISQVFVNLLSNAIKFNRLGGQVRVEAEGGRRGFVKVEVRDTGIGIPREALDKIFERFYQVDPSAARKQDGTGIGLSIVKNILRMHGCMIRADSVLGEGSVFSFTLPAARRARHEKPAARAEGEEPAAGAEGRERSRPSRPLGEEGAG